MKHVRTKQKVAKTPRTRKSAASKPPRKRSGTARYILSALLIILFIFLFTAGAIIFHIFVLLDNNVDDFLESIMMNQSSVLYYKDTKGQWLEQEKLFSGSDRIWVPLSEIPKSVQDAAIAIEDKRFMSHAGVDLRRTFGAVISLFTGETNYGGSTITQQVIKNVTQDDAVSMRRKVQEIARALELERNYSKDQILEMYLNTMYLSQNCNGIQAASKTFFGKDASELSLAESASLVGITQFPGRYDPFIHPDHNKNKQELILKEMCNQGLISEEERDAAIAEELVFNKEAVIAERKSVQSYYTDQVIEDIIADLYTQYGYNRKIASSLIYSGGLKIYTAMDKSVQDAMDSVFANNPNFPTVVGSKQPEAAMVIVDPNTGALLALYGGRGEKTGARLLNRATQSKRSPGSSIKPIAVYAPGLEYKVITAASVFDDIPFDIEKKYPKNYTKTYSGLMTVKEAVEVSNNAVAVRALDALGFEKSYKFLTENLGVTSIVKRTTSKTGKILSDLGYGPLALGGLTNGISVREITAAYVPFSNGGLYYKPYTYTSVVDSKGNVLLENSPQPTVAMREETSYLMNSLLLNAVENGTGSPAKIPNQNVAGKTGTTSDDYDRWFVGYTPYYVGGVWYGFDTNKTIVTTKSTNPALSLWRQVMVKIHQGKDKADFPVAKKIVTEEVCLDSGLLPGPGCKKDLRGNRVKEAIFEEGTVPTEKCDIHVPVKICSSSRQVAGRYCPSTYTAYMINVKREFPYTLAVADAQYTYIPSKSISLVPGTTYPVYKPLLASGMTAGYTANIGYPANACCHYHTGYKPPPDDDDDDEKPSDGGNNGGTPDGNNGNNGGNGGTPDGTGGQTNDPGIPVSGQ